MKKRWLVLLIAVCLTAVLPLALGACGGGDGDEAIVGVWTDELGMMDYEFTSDGRLLVTFTGETEEISYIAKDGRLSFVDPETGEEQAIDFRVEADTLLMTFEGEEGVLVRK